MFVQAGSDPGFGFRGGPCRAPKAQGWRRRRRREYIGMEYGERVSPPHWGCGLGRGLKMRIFVRSPALLFLQRNKSRSIPALRLPTLTFQADCGSIKGAGVSAEEGVLKIIFPGGEYMTNSITVIANVKTLSHNDS